jgi:hypothetical protein
MSDGTRQLFYFLGVVIGAFIICAGWAKACHMMVN